MTKQIGVHNDRERGRARRAPGVVTVLAAAAFVLAWSSGFTIAAVATVDAPATTLLLWRFLPLAVLLAVAAAARGRLRGVPRVELRRQAGIGLLAQFGYVVFVYAAVGAGVATGSTALVDAVQPLVVATLVGPLLGLRVRGAQWAGLGVGAIGVVLVVGSQLGDSDAPAWAWALPALAMASLIAGTLVERRGGAELPVLTTLTVHVSVTAAALVVLAAATGTLVPPPSPAFWAATVLSALVPTLAAYGLYWWLLRRLGVTALNALLFLVAPTTAASGALLLGEPLTAWTLAGFVLSGAGSALVLAGGRGRRAPVGEALAAA
jgi:drug/metabolite transporter (DMT)-like permease